MILQVFNAFIVIVQSGEPGDLIVRDLQDIAVLKAPVDLDLRLIETLPERRTQVRVKRTDQSAFFRAGNRLLCRALYRLIRQRQGSLMEDLRIFDQL